MAKETFGEKFRKFNSYTYYTTPEGHDYLHKLWYTTKFGIKAGYSIGLTCAYANWEKSTSRFLLLFHGTRIAIPYVISSIVFTTAAYNLTQYRKVDDEINVGVAGALAGALVGIWFRHTPLGIAASLSVAGLASFKKCKVLRGEEFPIRKPVCETSGPWDLTSLDFAFIPNDGGEFTRVLLNVPKPPPQPPPPPPPPPSKVGICASFE